MMENVKWLIRKYGLPFLILLIIVIAGGTFLGRQNIEERNDSEEVWESPLEIAKEDNEDDEEVLEKGYNLPIGDSEREEAEADCKRVMALISDIYEHADKGDASNVVISDETVSRMQDKVKETKCPVASGMTYSNMENYKDVEDFLKACLDGKSGSIIIYEIHSDGGIGRDKYAFDGTDMYVLDTKAIWNEENEPEIAYVSYKRIKEWEYTDKGWFCYELCVPEPPEVTEIVDGSCMLRVIPMKDEYREISEKCVLPLGYQGNNLLCSNWNTEHLEDLDYNGMYEYLYGMKYQEKFPSEEYPNGISKDEFEGLIMEYLPVTSEQIQKYAVFDEETQTYTWARLGCSNYAPTFFGTSIPEVTDIKENENGTVTLTLDAVCEMILCDESVITHELTVRFSEDGSFQYLGNEILGNGIQNMPEYQYRLRK